MKTNNAVLHITSKKPMAVAELSERVAASMAANKTVFPTPDPTLEEFNTERGKLNTNIAEKDGSKIKNQIILDQTNVVFAMLKLLLNYTNKVANGDKTIILLSGFDCSNEPVAHGIPGKALIKRVEDGEVACSAKIYMEPLNDADRYRVETTTTSNDPKSWTTTLDYVSLNNLEIANLTRGEEIYIRVTGGNRHGWGMVSEPVSFMPR
ncbi:hypothetical protein [Microbacter margulisiae]|uniref:Fibronectin type-III domain-containing protein n=1 Tax=Microbacter margulisiae TaxID=1350067 RepID=A0A7W5H0Z1_9PORP|nr:hypothetical protein [Microbacter margulisiae]MBB3186094.1 hypothetical protein [Microbacter margulisiae]